MGSIEEAEQQLMFLREVQSAIIDKSPELLYLVAQLAWLKERDSTTSMQTFTTVIDLHFKSLKGIPFGIEYFVKLCPDFLVDVAKEYLQHFGEEPIDQSTPIPECVQKASKLLEIVSKAVPGHRDALYLLARTRFSFFFFLFSFFFFFFFFFLI